MSENNTSKVEDKEFEETLFVKRIIESWIALPSVITQKDIIPEKHREIVGKINTFLYHILEAEGYFERKNAKDRALLESMERFRITKVEN